MFESLSERLSASLKAMAGKSRLTEDNIRETLRDVRMALLEADVALSVVKDFTDRVKERAVGTEVTSSLTPGQVFLKIVQSELQSVMGEANEKLNLAAQPPAVVMVAGLQGAGKTTSVAKLARYLMEREKKKVRWSVPTSIDLQPSSSWKPWPRRWARDLSRHRPMSSPSRLLIGPLKMRRQRSAMCCLWTRRVD